MCFTAIVYSKERLGKTGYSILLNTLNKLESNPDGFGIRVDNRVFRTLNRDKFIKFILKHDRLIENSKLVHLHYRLASCSGITKNNVHLWSIGDYLCSHNGTTYTYKYSDLGKDSDSLAFFKESEKMFKEGDLSSFADKIRKDNAWGVFLMSSGDGKRLIVASETKPLKVSIVNDDVVVLSSDDIKYTKNIVIGYKRRKLWGFEVKAPMMVKLDSFKPFEVFKTESENMVKEIDLESGKSRTVLIPHPLPTYSKNVNDNAYFRGYDKGDYHFC